MADALIEPAGVRVARDDDLVAATVGKGSLFGVEAQSGLALGFVRPMAGETLVGKDGSDVAIEIDRGRGFAGMQAGDGEKRYGGKSGRCLGYGMAYAHCQL